MAASVLEADETPSNCLYSCTEIFSINLQRLVELHLCWWVDWVVDKRFASAKAALLFQAEADELRDCLLSLVCDSLQGFTLFRADLRPDRNDVQIFSGFGGCHLGVSG